MFWPFIAWINCSSDLKNFANSWPSASIFKRFSQSLNRTIGQNNFGNKIPFHFSPWILLNSSNLTIWRKKNQRFDEKTFQFKTTRICDRYCEWWTDSFKYCTRYYCHITGVEFQRFCNMYIGDIIQFHFL